MTYEFEIADSRGPTTQRFELIGHLVVCLADLADENCFLFFVEPDHITYVSKRPANRYRENPAGIVVCGCAPCANGAAYAPAPPSEPGPRRGIRVTPPPHRTLPA